MKPRSNDDSQIFEFVLKSVLCVLTLVLTFALTSVLTYVLTAVLMSVLMFHPEEADLLILLLVPGLITCLPSFREPGL